MAAVATLLFAASLVLCSCTGEKAPSYGGGAQPESVSRGDGTDGWFAEVSARIRDASHAFVRDGDAWTAEVEARGLSGRFDAEGARLSLGEDSFHIAVVDFGRDAPNSWEGGGPELGECVENRKAPDGACVRRLEYGGVGLTEWWVSQDEGFEQGWTVDTPPDGDGALTLQLAVDGAEVELGEGELLLQGDAGGLLAVSGLEARDADGVTLPAWFERADGGFRVRVQDAAARYPLQIDPVYTTVAWSAYGDSYDWDLGESVSGAGDVNADGYDDVIVGAPDNHSDRGRVYVYLGSAGGMSSTAATTLTGEADGDEFGISVSGVGDIDGDGYDDVIVGAPGCDAGTGCAYVYAGSASGPSSTPVTTWTGDSRSDAFGISVSGAGDINGDGYDDVIVGAHAAGSTGRTYVYTGSAGGLSSTAAATLLGEVASDSFGYAVSGAGDVNGDGYDDVIVGAFEYGTSQGRAYVYAGSAIGPDSLPTTTLTGETPWAQFGISVAGAGDVNGDGYDDVIVGAPESGLGTGSAYVYEGSASGLSITPETTWTGEATSDLFGISVSDIGDINGDGYDDVIVGASYVSTTGSAYIYTGSAGGLSGVPATTWSGEDSRDRLGYAVSGAGDVDGDGYDDVVVGVPGHSDTGAVGVYLVPTRKRKAQPCPYRFSSLSVAI